MEEKRGRTTRSRDDGSELTEGVACVDFVKAGLSLMVLEGYNAGVRLLML
jgi:hypothetical protein